MRPKTAAEVLGYHEQNGILLKSPAHPDLLSRGFNQQSSSGLWLSRDYSLEATSDAMHRIMQFSYTSMLNSYWGFADEKEVKPPLPEEPFEMNLAEALVGWKAWEYRDGKILSASQTGYQWKPLEALKAECIQQRRRPHGGVVQEGCSCGIYATDARDGTESYDDEDNTFVGLIYGWGRYVRGESGWRAQFAYPKAFHLKSHQINYIDALREFRVPIRIDQPIDIYNPEEDGYGHGDDETNWNLGTAEGSDSAEDFDADEED